VELPINAPRVQAVIGGVDIPGVFYLTIDSLGYFAASRFSIGFALNDLVSSSYFAALGAATIAISVAEEIGFANLITGQIDNIRIDLLNKSAILSGRDLSARLIDAEIFETFNNQTSSQIADLIAGRFDLSPNITATSTPVGQYYELDHARNALALHSRSGTAWNLLSQLAQLEGFILSVTGTTLNFGPKPILAPVLLTPNSTMKLEFEIATTIPTAATVKSWNSRGKTAVSQTAGAYAGTVLIRPNLTAAQAGAVAADHLASLSQHGKIVTITMPGDANMVPAAQIIFSGAGAGLDQTYTVGAIRRSLDAERGFTQTLRAYASAA
jgi:phage protein D